MICMCVCVIRVYLTLYCVIVLYISMIQCLKEYAWYLVFLAEDNMIFQHLLCPLCLEIQRSTSSKGRYVAIP